MSLATSSPVIFFNHAELITFVEKLSDRVRCDPQLAPALRYLVGNHWQALEKGLIALVLAHLNGRSPPRLSADRLNRALAGLSRADCHRLHELFMATVFSHFPFHDASRLVDLGDGVLYWILPLLEEKDLRQRQRKLLAGLSQWPGA